MYETHFGLREKPFSLLPDPRFLYVGRTHKVAVTMLRYGLAEQAGFVVLTGEVGTGKTTLLQHLLEETAEDTVVGLATNTHRAFGPLMRVVARAFGISHKSADALEQHDAFVEYLEGLRGEGRRAVLIVDEAQNLDDDALEQLRMLSNVNASSEPLLQLVLVGQPELRTTLQQPHFRQLVQRVWIDHHLQPLSAIETRAMLRHRLAVAGGAPELFDDEAAAAVHYFSRGLPRLANGLAELALLYGFAQDASSIGIDTVIGVVEERQRAGALTAYAPLPTDRSGGALRRQIIDAVGANVEGSDVELSPRWMADVDR